MSSISGEMEEDLQVQGTSRVVRSPLSSTGESPTLKRAKYSPDPGPIAREAVCWLRHTFALESTKKTKMVVETQRLVFDKLEVLSSAVYDLIISVGII